MRKVILLAAILILYSCSSSKQTNDKWIGDTEKNIIKSWGSPVRVLDNGDQGEILIYAEQVYLKSKQEEGSRMAGSNYWNYEYVYVNKEGKIYLCRKEKQNKPPQQIVLQN
ncbi:hypothetical protein [Flavobacterium sp. JAS]|uniref:hypothetical protein n=1 Tax=Flavobacterium sp. JAS TaxID=2897329 RepID=UPI001E593D0C|nr:hypothetical protein [Flavobacterium sp. JAS]MCD0471715.1 hypothetical protein [Flavobacterium sp. JAS]